MEEHAARGFEDLGFARVDHGRSKRRGYPETIFCPGKTVDQVVAIAVSLVESGAENILATRASNEILSSIAATFSDALIVHEAHLCVLNPRPKPLLGKVAVVTRRFGEQTVAEEAAFTAGTMGSAVVRCFDAPMHSPEQLPDWMEELNSPNVIVAVDGDGGSLPSVIAGLTSCLVVAVPTSAESALRGLPSLLACLNSCVPGVVTVNIDNGFGGGYAAHIVNVMKEGAVGRDGEQPIGVGTEQGG